jgi:hypothetical protein
MPLTQQLYDLFLLEQQLRGISGRLDAAKRRQAAQSAKADQLQQQHDDMRGQLMHARAKTHELEVAAAEIDERTNRQREMMNTITTNKEYSALLVEVDTLKLEKSNAEDVALEQMQQVESLESELVELAAAVQEQTKLVAMAVSEVDACHAEVGEQLDDLQRQRDADLQSLPPAAQTTFEKLVNLHDGDGMAEVTEESRRNKEYACGGCYYYIPIERVSVLMGNKEDIVICPNCGRMLYMDKELRAALVK